MDPEQTFIRVQERFTELLTPRIRATLEYLHLFVAITLFCILVVMHANYVQQPGCSSELLEIETSYAQLIQIKISSAALWSQNEVEYDVINVPRKETNNEKQGVGHVDGDGPPFLSAKLWLDWISSGAGRGKSSLKFWKNHDEVLESQTDGSAGSDDSVAQTDNVHKTNKDVSHGRFSISPKESLKAALVLLGRKWYRRISVVWRFTKRILGGLWDIAGIHLNLDVPKWLKIFHLDKLNSYAVSNWLYARGSSIELYEFNLSVLPRLSEFVCPVDISVQWLGKRSKLFEPTYIYTVEKGYFLLPEEARLEHNIRTINISISAWHPCFGNRWQQLLINRLVGYDTILMNSLLNSPGHGYLYNYQTEEFYNITYAHKQPENSARFGDYLVTKCGVLMMSLFVFFTTTMSVSFTLRETQTRMLKFTVQLQHHARHRLPTFQLIFVHVIESLVFVPIMIGILFFLFEFYDDQLLAFMVLILVWLCELFTLISVRTPLSMKFFPRFFLLYFLVFHIYFFSYAYGFSYLALSTTAAFMQHLILYFWNRFEIMSSRGEQWGRVMLTLCCSLFDRLGVPALQRFLQNRRSRFQQHPDFHITSSTILASTLHITRLNTRNQVPVNADLPSGPGLRAGVGPTMPVDGATGFSGVEGQADNGHPDRLGNPLQLGGQPDLQQPEAGGNPGSMNSFSSLLLWILGGASSEGLNSFLSIFRDIRDHGQVFPGSSRPENSEVQNPE